MRVHVRRTFFARAERAAFRRIELSWLHTAKHRVGSDFVIQGDGWTLGLATELVEAIAAVNAREGISRAQSGLRFCIETTGVHSGESPRERSWLALVLLREGDDTVEAELLMELRALFAEWKIEVVESGGTFTSGDVELARVLDCTAVLTREVKHQRTEGWIAEVDFDAVAAALSPEVIPAPTPNAVLVAYFDAGIAGEALRIAGWLRDAGIRAHFVHGAKNLHRQFKEAQRFGDVRWTIIVGGVEWDRGEVALRNFATRDEMTCEISVVVQEVRQLLSEPLTPGDGESAAR